MENRTRTYIEDQIAKDKSEDAIDFLLNWLENTTYVEKRIYNRVVVMKGRLIRLLNNQKNGLVSESDYSVERNRINFSALSLLDEVSNLKYSHNNVESRLTVERELIGSYSEANYFKYDFFICYSTYDISIVEEIYDYLSGYGLRLFMAAKELRKSANSSYFEEIANALTQSKNLVLVVSDNVFKSEWAKSEYESFYNEFYIKDKVNRGIFLLSKEKSSINQIPLLLRRFQVLDHAEDIINFIRHKKLSQLGRISGKKSNSLINHEKEKHNYRSNELVKEDSSERQNVGDKKASKSLTSTKSIKGTPFSKIFRNRIFGGLLVFISSYLTIAFISYLFTWRIDQDSVLRFSHGLIFDSKLDMANWLGRLGALISNYFFYWGTGISSFVFCYLFFRMGISLWHGNFPKKNEILRMIHLSLIIFSISLFLEGVFEQAAFPWGGSIGEVISLYVGKTFTMLVTVSIIIGASIKIIKASK